MSYIELSKQKMSQNTIMIFVEGTILKPKSALGLFDLTSYVPIGKCAEWIRGWQDQGAEIVYCTSRRKKQVRGMADLLTQYGFTGTRLYYRNQKQQYKDVVEEANPNILIEDNCRSIGGSFQMCISSVDPIMKEKIKSVPVEEYKGIDHLPQSYADLLTY